MSFNIDDLKKKIIYRSNYRGTKEMDVLLTSFTKKYINTFQFDDLINFLNLLEIDDDNLYKFNQGIKTDIKIDLNEVSILFKNFVYNKN